MPRENTNPEHYGRPNLISRETSGIMYYKIDTFGQDDFSHMVVNFNGQTFNNYSISAVPITGMQYGNDYSIVMRPVDIHGNIGNTITYNWRVDKDTPIIVWSSHTVVEGNPLTYIELDAQASEPGTFVYEPPSGTILPVGNNTVSATFTPVDLNNFWIRTVTDTITVAPLYNDPPAAYWWIRVTGADLVNRNPFFSLYDGASYNNTMDYVNNDRGPMPSGPIYYDPNTNWPIRTAVYNDHGSDLWQLIIYSNSSLVRNSSSTITVNGVLIDNNSYQAPGTIRSNFFNVAPSVVGTVQPPYGVPIPDCNLIEIHLPGLAI